MISTNDCIQYLENNDFTQVKLIGSTKVNNVTEIHFSAIDEDDIRKNICFEIEHNHITVSIQDPDTMEYHVLEVLR